MGTGKPQKDFFGVYFKQRNNSKQKIQYKAILYTWNICYEQWSSVTGEWLKCRLNEPMYIQIKAHF